MFSTLVNGCSMYDTRSHKSEAACCSEFKAILTNLLSSIPAIKRDPLKKQNLDE